MFIFLFSFVVFTVKVAFSYKTWSLFMVTTSVGYTKHSRELLSLPVNSSSSLGLQPRPWSCEAVALQSCWEGWRSDLTHRDWDFGQLCLPTYSEFLVFGLLFFFFLRKSKVTAPVKEHLACNSFSALPYIWIMLFCCRHRKISWPDKAKARVSVFPL